MKNLNFTKILLVVCLSLLFSSCGKKKKLSDNAVTGSEHGRQLVMSKRCPNAVVHVSRQKLQSSANALTQNLVEGESVIINGTVKNASPCYQGSASFCCSAQVLVGNRTLVCQSGTVVFGGFSLEVPRASCPNNSVTSLPQTQVYPHTAAIPHYSGATRFLGGELQIYDNGQKFYGRMINSSAYQTSCVISFSCP